MFCAVCAPRRCADNESSQPRVRPHRWWPTVHRGGVPTTKAHNPEFVRTGGGLLCTEEVCRQRDRQAGLDRGPIGRSAVMGCRLGRADRQAGLDRGPIGRSAVMGCRLGRADRQAGLDRGPGRARLNGSQVAMPVGPTTTLTPLSWPGSAQRLPGCDASWAHNNFDTIVLAGLGSTAVQNPTKVTVVDLRRAKFRRRPGTRPSKTPPRSPSSTSGGPSSGAGPAHVRPKPHQGHRVRWPPHAGDAPAQ